MGSFGSLYQSFYPLLYASFQVAPIPAWIICADHTYVPLFFEDSLSLSHHFEKIYLHQQF